MVVSIDTANGFEPGRPELLFERDFSDAVLTGGLPDYDIDPASEPGSESFIMLKPVELEEEEDGQVTKPFFTEIVVVQNWIEKLKRDTPVKEAN
jgi:hypothetical protein